MTGQPSAGRRWPAPAQWALLLALVFVPAALAVWAFAPSGSCACTPTRPPAIASPVDGVVIFVDSGGLSDVRGFRLRTVDEMDVEFMLGRLENATEFSPSHLAEHMATSTPVRVWFRVSGVDLVVYRLEDAPVSPAAT